MCLLGEPACGKSSISKTLSLFAADEWKCSTLKIDSPQELKHIGIPMSPANYFGRKKFRWRAPSRFNDPFDIQVELFDFNKKEWVDIFHNEFINVIAEGSSVYSSRNQVTQSLQELWQRGEISREQLEDELESLKEKQVFNLEEIALDGNKVVREFCSENRVFCIAIIITIY